ncbi:phenolic glucoside malonyltransferase 1-like [Phragmites australis]|uniref:phenolic glucoside malonyltransferase 1-like n=1 Tax=Phragmites australis TaxID=29695 RepID=UPI002D78EE0A|nr:phenolic glucoside malonyltransferase 1-like [Phragmites australis]
MPLSVTILEEARVAVPATAGLPAEPIRLSALDAQWVTIPLIQRLLIFVDGAGSRGIPPFASVVAALRQSLAETVARFLPLAGRLVHLPSTGDAAIDCTERGVAGGVRFIVAESDGADAARLAGDADHDAEAFGRLVPVLDAGQLPAETMAAQVTRLQGGLAVSVALHHAVVDGRSVWRFLEAWAAACRGEGDADAAAAPPTFDRAAIKLPGGEELARSVLRRYAPDLPVAPMAALLVHPILFRRTFTITAQKMLRLKQRIADFSPVQQAAAMPSSFVAVAALAWVSFVCAKHPDTVSPDDDVYLFFFADCRARLNPPPGERYFGTCITGCLAKATARDLLAESGVARAAAAVAEEVRRAAEEPLAMWEWMDILSWIPLDRLVNMAGSTRFPAYEAADFGWGPPGRTELVTMHHNGQVVLVAGKKDGSGAGAVQASVAIVPAHMEAFKSHFLSYLG